MSQSLKVEDEFQSDKDLVAARWEHEDLAKVKVKVFRGHSKGINHCSFLKDGQWLLSAADDKTIQLWERDEGVQRHVYEGHSDKVSCAKGTPDTNRIISCGWDKRLICWDLESGQEMWSKTLSGIVMSCDVSMDGKYGISGNDLDHAVHIWNLSDGQLIKQMKHHSSTVTSCCFSPIQHRFCTAAMDKTSHIIDMRNYKDEMDPHTVLKFGGHTNIISSVSFSGNEKILATASWDKNIQLWDLNSGSYRRSGPVTLSKGHVGSVSGCKLSQDGSILISSSYDETLIIWDIRYACKNLSLKGHTGWVTSCDLSKNNKWALSASKDRTLRLWNLEESDHLPVVLQNRKNIGLKLLVCSGCGKNYSIAEALDPESVKFCVFCRLKRPSSLYVFDSESGSRLSLNASKKPSWS